MWLHVPSTSYPSAPASECTTLDSEQLSTLARSATSSGKPSPPRSWSALWKRNAWMRRLSGLTLPPSTLARGAALWTESLAASRASLGAPPASRKAKTTTAGFGPSSLESFGKLNRHCASSKTCLDLFQAADSNTSFLTLPASGSMSNGIICQQPRLALRTNETASGYWPSSRAEDSESCGNHPAATERSGQGPENKSLLQDASKWQTPKAGEEDSGSGMNSRGEAKLKAQLWTTPKALTGGANSKREERGAGGPDLQEQTMTWASPMARDWRGGGASHCEAGREIEDGHAGLAGGSLFAPGPADDRWGDIIARHPWLSPATQPGVHGMADGLAVVVDESRRHQLRAIGNGGVPLCTAVAFAGLARRAIMNAAADGPGKT